MTDSEKDAEAQEASRVVTVNASRAARRGFIVFATDPDASPDEPGYRQIFATEAETAARAIAKVRPVAGECRLRAYLIREKYGDELAEAIWVP